MYYILDVYKYMYIVEYTYISITRMYTYIIIYIYVHVDLCIYVCIYIPMCIYIYGKRRECPSCPLTHHATMDDYFMGCQRRSEAAISGNLTFDTPHAPHPLALQVEVRAEMMPVVEWTGDVARECPFPLIRYYPLYLWQVTTGSVACAETIVRHRGRPTDEDGVLVSLAGEVLQDGLPMTRGASNMWLTARPFCQLSTY